MILAIAGQFKQLSHEPEKFRWLNEIRTHDHGMLQVYSDDNVFCDNCQKYKCNEILKWTWPARTLYGREFIRDKDVLFRLKL